MGRIGEGNVVGVVFNISRTWFCVLVLFVSTKAQASERRPLTEPEALARCYNRISGLKLAATDPLFQGLRTKSAAQVCSELLDSVQLNATTGILQNSNSVSRQILKQFYDIHRSWFERKTMTLAEFGDALYGTIDIYDLSEPALNLTRLAFLPGAHYSQALRGSVGVEGIRDSSKASTYGSTSGFKRMSRYFFSQFDGDGFFGWNNSLLVYGNNYYLDAGVPPTLTVTGASGGLVSVGELTGIRDESRAASSPNMYTHHTMSAAVKNESTLILPHSLFKNYGGGVLGSQTFLLFNFGHGMDYTTNGTTKLPRKWIATALKSFICREGPYLRTDDVLSYVRNSAQAGVPPFRGGVSCIRCHATMDQAAITARNLVPASTFVQTAQSIVRGSASVAAYTGATAAPAGQELWPSTPVDGFKNQPPNGKLYFRSINGSLINLDVNGIDALGTALSNTDDYYACAASRYFEYFTGFPIRLLDPGDSDNQAELAQYDTAYQEKYKFVLKIGSEFKASGSMKTLVKRIIESDFFLNKAK